MKTTSVLRRIFKENRISGAFAAQTPFVITDSKQIQLIRQGRNQFKKLVDYGLTVPVGML